MRVASAIHVRGVSGVGQSYEGRAASANHRRGESDVSQSQKGGERCQPITGRKSVVSANH
jgi:hypothetical protein